MHTPADLAITPRDIQFGRESGFPRWWLNNDPVATAFYNALSVTFPQGERYFMDAVRRYKDRVPDALKPQIAAFLTQEAMHSREHLAFNQIATQNGYDIKPAEERLRFRLSISRKLPAPVQLAATAALEHFTAIFAHALLSNPAHLAGATPEAQRMWRWHAMEEIEHKAVAFDTLLTGVRLFGAPGRYLLRVLTILASTFLFSYTITRNVWDFFEQDGINTWATWKKFFAYVFKKPGMLANVGAAYFDYYKPGFHPWKQDDRALLVEAEAALAAPA